MKQALINLRGIKAGILTEDEDGYTFQYDTEFLQSEILKHPAVRSASSTFVLQRVKYTTMLPLAQ